MLEETVEIIYSSKYQESLFNSFVDFYFSDEADDPVYVSSSLIDIDSDVSEKTNVKGWYIL